MNDNIQAFKSNFDIVKVAEDLNCLPPKRGAIYQGGNCPAGHTSKGNKCFTLYPGTQSGYCYHCGIFFDVIELPRIVRGLEFKEACNWLSDTYYVPRLDTKEMTEEERIQYEAKIKQQSTIFTILTEAAHFYHEKLMADDEMKSHLINHYGLSKEIILSHFLGYSSGEGLLRYLLDKGYRREDILSTGLFNKGNYEIFNNRLIFPYWNTGKVVYFIGRQTSRTPGNEFERAKYIKLSIHNEKHPYLSEFINNSYYYGEESIKGKNKCFVAEGVTDCLSLLQADEPCISPVTVRFREADFPRLEKLTKNISTIYLIPDNEENEAGIRGAMDTASKLEELDKTVYIIILPRHEGQEKIDLNEFLRDHSKTEFDELVKQAKSPWEIKIDRLTVPSNKIDAICSARYFVLTELLHYDELTVRAIIKEYLKKKFALCSDDIKDLQRLWSEEKRGKNKAKQPGNVKFDRDPIDPLANTSYLMKPDGFYYLKKTADGPVPVSLSNFTAEVTSDVIKDDGAEQVRVFEIVGQSANGKKLPAITIPAEKFFAMNWVGQWGVDAVVSAGMGVRDRVREVIQLVSRKALKIQVFTHIGWRKIDGKWIYLYNGGAIGRDDISVNCEDALQNYFLSATGDAQEGIKLSLSLLDIAPLKVTLPLWAAVWRSPTACLLYPTLVLWLYGTTGSYKSTLGALFLSHFGGPFTKENLPGSWLSTDNALERLAFLCRDALLLVDDYAPENHPREAAALDKRVNRFVRQIGNRAGRGRLKSDLTSRQDFIPNALVISTGEQLPLGVSSVGARILPVLCEREEVDLFKLGKAQEKAHLLTSAMRCYIEWLAPQMDELPKILHSRFCELRQKVTINGHARLPESVAHLQLGVELGLKYAVSLGVITKEKANEIEQKSWDILLSLVADHSKVLTEERPVIKFLQTLFTIFVQGKGHLLDRQTGKMPIEPETYGWKTSKNDLGNELPGPSGELLGWIDKDGLYLIPEAVFKAVNEYLRSGGGLPVRERTLRDSLAQEKILILGEDGRTTRKVRIQGVAQRVLNLDKSLFLSFVQNMGTSGTDPTKSITTLTEAFPENGNNMGILSDDVGTVSDRISLQV